MICREMFAQLTISICFVCLFCFLQMLQNIDNILKTTSTERCMYTFNKQSLKIGSEQGLSMTNKASN